MAGAAALAGMMGGAGAERAKQTEAAQANEAEDARLAKQLAQQQSQYDTTLAENQKEFGADFGLRSTAANDAHKTSDYTLNTLLPSQHEATVADIANTKARTAGVLGQNALADQTAGIQKQILAAQLAAAKQGVVNSAGDTVAHRDLMVREAQQAAEDLEAQREANERANIRLEASLRTIAATDPQAFLKQASAANTAAANEAQKLFGPTKPGEQPMLSDAERKLVLQVASSISGSANPLQAAWKAIDTGTTVKGDPKDPNSMAQAQLAQAATAKAASYLLQLGVAAQMTRMSTGSAQTTLAAAVPQAPPANNIAHAVPPVPAAARPGAIPQVAARAPVAAQPPPPVTPPTMGPNATTVTPAPGPVHALSLPQAPSVPPGAQQILAKARALPPIQRAAFIAQQPPAIQALLKQYFPQGR